MSNMIEILNTIRDNATQTYRDRIPEATQNNLEEIRYAMIDDDNVMVANEFVSTLLNKVAKTMIINKAFENPLKSLKKGKKPLGDTVEEIYTNFLKAEQYDATGAKLLNRNLPDVKTLYHRTNRKDKYKVTVSRETLQKAFASYSDLETFLNNIVSTLTNSAELDEFLLTKDLISSALKHNAMKTVEITDPATGETSAKDFIKSVKKCSNFMQFPNANWNAYLTAQDTDTVPLITFSKKNEQVLILDASTDIDVNVDVLASVFNMSVAEFNDTRKIVIDTFPSVDAGDVVGVLVDEAFFQIYDDVYTFKRFENAEGLYDNYYLHVWQTMAYSILCNAVAFVVPTAG